MLQFLHIEISRARHSVKYSRDNIVWEKIILEIDDEDLNDYAPSCFVYKDNKIVCNGDHYPFLEPFPKKYKCSTNMWIGSYIEDNQTFVEEIEEFFEKQFGMYEINIYFNKKFSKVFFKGYRRYIGIPLMEWFN